MYCRYFKPKFDHRTKNKSMVSLRSGKKVPFLGKNIPKRPHSYRTTLEPEDETVLASRLGSISIQNHDASTAVNQTRTKQKTKQDEISEKIMNFVASSKELIQKVKSSGLHESDNSFHIPEESSNYDGSSHGNLLSPEPSSMSECELTFDLINDTLVEKINEASSWDDTFKIDPLLEVCDQAYNEILNDLIFEDIIYETLFVKYC